MIPVRILATATAVPNNPVTAVALDERLALPPGTTLARNAVATRYFASPEDSTSGLAAAALEQALKTANLPATSLDAILFASVLPEHPMPTTATLIHQRLGARALNVTCLDLNASCGGLFRALELGAAMIATGQARTVALVACELASLGLNWADLDTATLFGDGAAAILLGEAVDDEGIVEARSLTLSEAAYMSTVLAGGTSRNVRRRPDHETDYFFAMNGPAILRVARHYLPGFVQHFFSSHPIRHVVPHQASAVGLASLRRILREHNDTPYTDILSTHGNQVSASIGFALHHAITHHHILRGDTILLLGTAAGLTIHGIALRY
jgi:3-oxoacyl-[acyl-carrier-protein] synthase III